MTSDITSPSFWDEAWKNAALPRVLRPNKEPVDWRMAQFFKKFLPNHGSVLEIGCGASNVLPFLSQKLHMDVWGIDYSQEGFSLAQKNLEILKVPGTIIMGDFLEFHQKSDFDCIYSGGVIEHYSDPRIIFKKSATLLKSDGLLVTIIPNLTGLWGRLQRWLDIELFEKHFSYSCEDLDQFQRDSGFLPVLAPQPFGVFYLGLLGWSRKVSFLPSFLQKILAYLFQYLDRIIGWTTIPFGNLFETRYFSPFIVSVYRKK